MNAIILAGGKGSRLQPWHAPKCLLPINGVTILQRLLEHVFHGGKLVNCHKAVVCTGYRAEDVKASLRAHRWAFDKVIASNAGEDAAMGERLLKVRELQLIDRGERVVVCYGDELADVNLEKLIFAHDTRNAMMTFAVAQGKTLGGGIEFTGSNDVCRIVEDQKYWVNIGFVVVEPVAWNYLQPGDGVSDWVNRVNVDHPVVAYPHAGKRATVNSLADLTYAEEVWK